tara:strand:+ start:842 stop:1243 length:402 start_codon:yes stop_codon:yes gene_type:complete
MSKIRIYTSETCPYCKQLKQKFEEKNIEFENKLINEFKDEWQDIINLTEMPTVPTIKYMGEYFIPGRDFQNPEQLISKLKNYKISPHNEREKIFQKIKTLHYHMNMAFSKMDQLLKQIENKLNIKEDEHESTN